MNIVLSLQGEDDWRAMTSWNGGIWLDRSTGAGSHTVEEDLALHGGHSFWEDKEDNVKGVGAVVSVETTPNELL